MSSGAFDFREPGRLPDDLQQVLAAWQRPLRAALELRWGRHMPCPLRMASQPPHPFRGAELSSRYEQEVVAHRVDVVREGLATVFVMPRNVVLALVRSMLGDVPAELPEDRVLTEIEQSIADLLMSEIDQSLQESQPRGDTAVLLARGPQRLRELHKEFPETEPVVALSFELDMPFGTHRLDWNLSQAATLELAAGAAAAGAGSHASAAQLKEIMRSVPLDVVVRLGKARLHLSELAGLRVGDVLVLDQRLTDPLTAEVGGRTKYTGWPGRAGSKQAFQIESIVD